METCVPELTFEAHKSFLFGMIKIDITVEDRRPDLQEYSEKYKHCITIKAFSWNFSTVIRSNLPGIRIVQGKEII